MNQPSPMGQRVHQAELLPSIPTDLEEHAETFRQAFADELKSASLFLRLLDVSDAEAMRRGDQTRSQIISRLGADTQRIPLSKLGWPASLSETVVVERFAIRNRPADLVKAEIRNIFAAQADGGVKKSRRGRVAQHGLFLPRTGSITCHSFAHGEGHYYRYRLATFKLDPLPEGLRSFLLTLPAKCPDRYFSSGPRASNLNLRLKIEEECSTTHPMVRLAQEGLSVRKLKSAHEDIEKHLLECDQSTIACEVPLWFEPQEFQQLALLKGSEGTLTGHIDVLRCEQDGKIAIWDYKPSAEDETKAHVQVFLYALMLSKRTGMPLEQFRCGYFDSKIAVLFQPAEAAMAATCE